MVHIANHMEYRKDWDMYLHKESHCVGPVCVIHSPSDHNMRNFSLHWRGDRGLFERICFHGVGHPDPDDLWYHKNVLLDDSAGVHGCDGCCGGAYDSLGGDNATSIS